MGYRERRAELWAERAASYLEAGEQIQTGFIAQTGWFIFTVPIATFVATDRAILVLSGHDVQRLPVTSASVSRAGCITGSNSTALTRCTGSTTPR